MLFTALWNIEYVQYCALHRELMTPDAYRSSQIRKFLTGVIKHDSRNQIAKGSIQPDLLKILSCPYFLCQGSELSSWLIPYSETTVLLHHWINFPSNFVLSLRGVIVFGLGMQRCSHTHTLAVMCLYHTGPLHPYCGPLFAQEFSEAETRV